MDASNETKQEEAFICIACNEKYPAGTGKCPKDGTPLTPLASDRLVGTIFLDKYEILEILGHGGMCTVYKARHTLMHNLVAIKVLHSQLVSDPTYTERILREARALSSLRHRNIVQVFDSGVLESQPYLIQEFLGGESLADLLAKHSYLPVERALHLFLQICDGLKQAHKKSIIHRDLKTSNIIIVQEPDAKDVVKLLDFGIAKVISADPKNEQKLTKSGEVFGSPLYMSPEQCTGGQVDERSDIYSFGCVMYETLTGSPPHVGANSLETMNKHVNEPVLSLRGIAPNLVIPELIDAVVLKALKKNPNQRHQSVEELKKELLEAATRSRIYIEGMEKATYESDPFSVNITTKQLVPEEPKEEEKKQEASKEMQKLVLDAVSLAEKQELERKKLKGYLFVLYGLLAAGLIFGTFLLLWQGPPQDRGPVWQKLVWQWQLAQGDDALEHKDFKGAEEHYLEAANLAKGFGDEEDRLIKTLFALGKVYKETGKTRELNETKSRIYEADSKRLESEFIECSKNGTFIPPLRTSLDVENLDAGTAKKYSERFTQLAKQYLAKNQIENAHRALEKALAIEEYQKSENASAVLECAHQIAGSCQLEQHKKHLKTLVERAERLR